MYISIIAFLIITQITAAPTCASSLYAVTDPLPLVSFPLPQSWAGEMPIGAPYGNDKLFFWLWKAQSGGAWSDDLIIWLNGGPGCSSMLGLFKEHGPILFPGNSTTPQPNPFSWTKLANVLYVDQPVGTGFSHGNHGAGNNDDDTAAFVQWLGAFFAAFPALKSKKIHILGESYAGIFIPYIADAIQRQHTKLGIKITSIGLGDSTWGNTDALTNVVATSFIKRHLHNYGTQIDPTALSVLEQADIDCGFSAVLSQLTYPPAGKIVIPGDPEDQNYRRRQAPPPGYDSSICDFTNGTHTPAEVAFIINDTSLADGCYGNCATFEAAYNYFAGFNGRCFNAYNIDTDCNDPLYTSDSAFAAYLNLPAVQAAIHAPKARTYTQCNGTLQLALTTHDQRSVPPAYVIIPSLLASDVRVNLWSGSLDYVLNPIGTQLSIQNMTWNGLQGFHDKPDREWFDVEHGYAGVWGAERGLGFYLFQGAGHRTAQDRPKAAFTMVRDRVVKNKQMPSS